MFILQPVEFGVPQILDPEIPKIQGPQNWILGYLKIQIVFKPVRLLTITKCSSSEHHLPLSYLLLDLKLTWSYLFFILGYPKFWIVRSPKLDFGENLQEIFKKSTFKSFYAHKGFDPKYLILANESPYVILQSYKSNFYIRQLLSGIKKLQFWFLTNSNSLV